jgi:hypothetical protein
MKKIAVASILACSALGTICAALALRTEPPPQRAASPVEARGRLLDWSGRPLTASEDRWQPVLDLDALRRNDRPAQLELLAELAKRLGLAPERLLAIAADAGGAARELPVRLRAYEKERVAAWVERARPAEERPVVRFIRKPIRTYPEGAALAPVVGITNIDGDGIEGLELQHDAVLRRGGDVRVSIEAQKQRRVADALAEAMAEHELAEAEAVVVELATQRVAAMVSLPAYDPADWAHRFGPNLRLKPVTDVFQPGPLLQPFLLHGVFAAEMPERESLESAFVEARADAGVAMARALGRGGVVMALKDGGLAVPMRVDFPGGVSALLNRGATSDALLREFGNGQAVAMSLLEYATSLAGILTGTPPAAVTLAADGELAGAAGRAAANVARGRALQGALVKRARIAGHDLLADFGGVWASYRERVKDGDGARRGVVALFAPAREPRYLVVVKTRPRGADVTADELCAVGKTVIAVVDPQSAPTLGTFASE